MKPPTNRQKQKINTKNTMDSLEKLKKSGIMVISLNDTYQYRISGVLDIFPVNSRYHHIKLNKRDSFVCLEDLVKEYLGKSI